MQVSPLAGKPADPSMLVDVPRLVTAYYTEQAGPFDSRPARRLRNLRPSRIVARRGLQRGAHPGDHSGHLPPSPGAGDRRAALPRHRYARSLGAGVCQRSGGAGRQRRRGDGRRGRRLHADAGHLPRDPHPTIAAASAGSPTGSSSLPRTIPPRFGGFKYNPPHGGPADTQVTRWIEQRANAFIADELRGVERVAFERARGASTTHEHAVPRLLRRGSAARWWTWKRSGRARSASASIPSAARASRIGTPIGDRYGLDLEVVNHAIDPTFSFHDGRLGRPDPHGPLVLVRHGGNGRAQGAIRRRVRQRSGRRSAWDREPHAGIAGSQPLPDRRDRLLVRQPPAMAGLRPPSARRSSAAA